MSIGKITIVTPPDRLFNLNISYLLVNPSINVKQQFQSILSKSLDDVNVFVYEQEESDISWLLSTACQVDSIIIDVDSCSVLTSQFITFMLAYPNAYYITSNELTYLNLISKNRIYDLDSMVEQLNNNEEDDDPEE